MAVRKVPAAELLLAYCQLEMLRLLATGAPAGEASNACWELWLWLCNREPGEGHETVAFVEAAIRRSVRLPTTCLTESSQAARVNLGLPWGEFERRHGPGRASAMAEETTLAELAWMLDAVRRFSQGQYVLQAARQAHDAAAGRPRKRRPHADPGWLQAGIEAVQIAVWDALAASPECREWELCDARPSATVGGRW